MISEIKFANILQYIYIYIFVRPQRRKRKRIYGLTCGPVFCYGHKKARMKCKSMGISLVNFQIVQIRPFIQFETIKSH